MKKYFAKYLPVEEEIKKEDYALNPSNRKIVRVNAACLKNLVTPEWKKVKLFLCSRDVQVGDKCWTTVGGCYDTFQEGYDKQYWFKVIGEISPDAIWVKEGDEFDEDEILQKSETIMMEERLWLYNEEDNSSIELTLEEALEMNLKEDSNIHSYKIDHRYKWKDAEDEAEVTYYYKEYQIKCPTCKTYH